MRRFTFTSNKVVAMQRVMMAQLLFSSTLSKEARDAITKSLSRVKDEAKGQLLDLTDMNEASRNAGNALQEVLKRNTVDDSKVKGKIATLTASLKSYNTRLSNLQSEARAVQNEADALIKLLWGNSSATASASTDASQKATTVEDGDFSVDVPPMAKKIEEVLGEKVSTTASTSASSAASSTPVVETLEGDFIKEDLTAPKTSNASASSNGAEEDLEIELEVEPSSTSSASSSSSSSSASAKSANELLAEKATIPEITAELHNAGVDFSACRDSESLRAKYLAFLDGKLAKPAAPKNSAAASSSSQRTTQQPPTPRPPQQQQQQQQYQQPPPNTNETGVSADPYPNGVRKMVDPMRTVWEVKMDIAKERNIDANTINLWSGRTCLEDHKRLYDYPTIQQFPIEVRQKGDNPY